MKEAGPATGVWTAGLSLAMSILGMCCGLATVALASQMPRVWDTMAWTGPDWPIDALALASGILILSALIGVGVFIAGEIKRRGLGQSTLFRVAPTIVLALLGGILLTSAFAYRGGP